MTQGRGMPCFPPSASFLQFIAIYFRVEQKMIKVRA